MLKLNEDELILKEHKYNEFILKDNKIRSNHMCWVCDNPGDQFNRFFIDAVYPLWCVSISLHSGYKI